MKGDRQIKILLLIAILAAGLFAALFVNSRTPVEDPAENSTKMSSLSEWTVEESTLNAVELQENKSIYEQDSNLYDVYLNIFPTEDADGEVLTFKSFDLHQSRDHTYNPVLDCNIQILEPGEKRDILYQDDVKNATIRVRGNSSRGDTYKSYKVKLEDEATEFKGQKTLNINKHSEDVMKVSTKLCADLLSEVPDAFSYRTYFFRVWIRDASLPAEEQEYTYYGLYTDIEQPNKSYLSARGLPENGVMYKARDFAFLPDSRLKNTDDPEYSEEEFEESLGIREWNGNHDKLLEMLDAVNDMSRDFQEVFDEYFNEENFLTWMSFNLLIGNRDILNHNYILYSPENAKTWYFISWDVDESFFVDDVIPLPQLGIQKLNQNVLCNRYFRLPGSLEKIEAKMRELLEQYLTDEKINALIDTYMPVLEETIPLYPDVGLLSSHVGPADLEDYLRSRGAYMRERFEEFLESSQYPTPMYVDTPSQVKYGVWHFAWEPSYSFQERTITYNITVADDFNMEQVLLEEKGLVTPEYDAELELEPGQYFVKVTAVDSAGNEQPSMEHYEQKVNDHFSYASGVLEFTVE